jgi:cytidylate kinase
MEVGRDRWARRLAQELGLEEQAASKRVKESDAARADYLRRFYEVDHELPTHYDLVFNTDALSVEQVAALVAQAASG